MGMSLRLGFSADRTKKSMECILNHVEITPKNMFMGNLCNCIKLNVSSYYISNPSAHRSF